MAATPKAVERLIDAFSRFPGIGPKTASRLTYYLLRSGEEEAQALERALNAAEEYLTQIAGRFSSGRAKAKVITGEDPVKVIMDFSIEQQIDLLTLQETEILKRAGASPDQAQMAIESADSKADRNEDDPEDHLYIRDGRRFVAVEEKSSSNHANHGKSSSGKKKKASPSGKGNNGGGGNPS